MPAEERSRGRLGLVGWAVVLGLAFIGGWVLISNLLDTARPFWRYMTVASIAFTIGTFYGRFRRYERDEKRKNREIK